MQHSKLNCDFRCLQAGGRGFLARQEARRLRRLAAVVRIQAAARALIARCRFLRTRAAVLRIQAAYRGHTARSVAADLRWGCNIERKFDS